MSLYDEIKSHFNLPTAYEDWTKYRQYMTNYVITHANQVSLPLSFCANMDSNSLLPSLAIIGAGSCNDLDLNTLLPHFSKITLIDYNEDAFETIISNYQTIECLALSLNGLTDSHYREFCDELQYYIQCNSGNFTPEEFENYAITKVLEYLNPLTDYAIPLKENSYDYICCFGVHSQLQAMFSYIYHVFEVNLKEMYFHNKPSFSKRFSQHLRDANNAFIPRFHEALLSCAKNAVFLGLEHKRTTSDKVIEGAYQAFEDIQKRNLQIEEDTVLWPFLPQSNIVYEMKILAITV